MNNEILSKIPYRRGNPINPKIIFIGEAPGEHEFADAKKRAFIGPSGQLLDNVISSAGIDLSECYFTNVIKEKPDHKDIKVWIKQNQNTFNIYNQLLAKELQFVIGPKTTVLVPTGNVALQHICNKTGIESWRGSILNSPNYNVKSIPVIHPAAVLRVWKWLPVMKVDFQRIHQESKTKEISLPVRAMHIRPKLSDVQTYLQLDTLPNILSVDIETLTTTPNRIVSIQFAKSPFDAMCIPFQFRAGGSYWTVVEEMEVWRLIYDALTKRKLVGQNFVRFDTFMLHFHGIPYDKILNNVHLDTMEAFQCLQPDLPKGLDFLTSVYTREPFFKSEGKEWSMREGEDEFWTYGCKDACVTYEIYPQLEKELKEEKLWDFYQDKFLKMALPKMEMSIKGLKVDLKKREELNVEYTRDIIIEQSKLTVIVGNNVNVNSPKQMQELLYDKMKLPKVWKDGRITCDEDAILKLSAKHPSDVFKHVLKLRNLRLLHSNNILAKLDSDNRIRTSYGFTETGRFTSSKTPLQTGTNLQNITKVMRDMYIPDTEDGIFVQMDLSQAEARVVAWKGCLYESIELFAGGGDIHKFTASLIFNKKAEEITPIERYVAKRIRHAINYDMHPPKFAMTYNKDAAENGYPLITIGEAKFYVDKFHQISPNLKKVYHADIQKQLHINKTLVNPFGRRDIFHDRLGDDLYRAAYGWYAQSTIADLTNTILYNIWDEIKDSDEVRIAHQMHDAILFICNNKTHIKPLVNLIHKHSKIELDICADPKVPKLVVPVDIEAGRSWYKMSSDLSSFNLNDK